MLVKDALEKLQAEVTAANADEMVTDVGAFLMDYVRSHPEHASLIAAKDKTIEGSITAMGEVARKRQKNGRARLSSSEGFAIILGYYGVNDPVPASPMGSPASIGLKVSLDDLL